MFNFSYNSFLYRWSCSGSSRAPVYFSCQFETKYKNVWIGYLTQILLKSIPKIGGIATIEVSLFRVDDFVDEFNKKLTVYTKWLMGGKYC